MITKRCINSNIYNGRVISVLIIRHILIEACVIEKETESNIGCDIKYCKFRKKYL